jgi:hypothetical protein
MGQMEMKCISNIGKNISIWAKVTQVRDVAHGPLVFLCPRHEMAGGHIVLPFVILSFHKLVSVQYLLKDCTYLIQIWYMDTS